MRAPLIDLYGFLVKLQLVVCVLAGALIGGAGACNAGCTSTVVQTIKHDVVDCTASNGAEVANLLATLRPLVALQEPDWAKVKEAAIAAGRAVGGCALAELIDEFIAHRLAAPASLMLAAPQTEVIRARATLEDVRAIFGGPTFHTDHGDL